MFASGNRDVRDCRRTCNVDMLPWTSRKRSSDCVAVELARAILDMRLQTFTDFISSTSLMRTPSQTYW